jgi:hypothetical protein
MDNFWLSNPGALARDPIKPSKTRWISAAQCSKKIAANDINLHSLMDFITLTGLLGILRSHKVPVSVVRVPFESRHRWARLNSKKSKKTAKKMSLSFFNQLCCGK